MGKKKCPECPKVGAKWLTTFSDLTTLLLTFFVLLLSMANFDKVQFENMFSVLTGSLGVLDLTGDAEFNEMQIIDAISSQQAIESTPQKIEETLEEYTQTQNLEQLVSVVKTDKGVSIRVMDSVFFAPGSSTLLPAASPILNKIMTLIQDTPYYVNIEGHTDDIPINNNTSLNWDLSTNRAVSVVKYFANNGFNPIRLSASGYGQFHPLLPNITSSNRAKNRRVEINITLPEFAESGANIFNE